MTCDTFRAQFAPATDDVALLEHLRSCDGCLNFAVEQDGGVLFRSLGGEDLVPPGGVDAFVSDVMREVRLRGTETTVTRRAAAWPRRLAVAATFAVMLAGTTFIYYEHRGVAPIGTAAVVHHRFRSAEKPVIENYDSKNATIVEVPSAREDVTVIMVFDDSLPADL